MKKASYEFILAAMAWLTCKVASFDNCNCSFENGNEKNEIRVCFSKVSIDGVNTIKGDISYMKLEFGQYTDITASGRDRKGNPATFQEGTEAWQHAFTYEDGSDASADFTLEPNPGDPNNNLKRRLTHTGTRESTGVVTFRADGDPDADETADVVGTLDVVVDASNVVAVDMISTEGVDVPTPPTGGGEGEGGPVT